MAPKHTDDEKVVFLQEHGALNQRPEGVEDELFRNYDFFDARDIIQVKYEMLRRVMKDGGSVTQATKSFGFSRPSFYQAQDAFEKHGLPGLLPRRRGPREPHKLSDEVMDFIEQVMGEDASLRPRELTELVRNRFGFTVHPRTIERGLERREKKRQGRP